MRLINLALLSSSLIIGLGMAGCSDTESSSTPPSSDPTTNVDPNTTTTGGDPTTEVFESSAGIYLAESNESTKEGYEFYTHPVYIGSTLYTRQYRPSYFTTIAMRVVGYDMNQFTADTPLADLLTENVYEQEGPNYTNARFNQRYYDIAEVDGALYFSTLPENVDTLSQSSYIKYDIASKSVVYHQKGTPWIGENLNTTFDLARGWFMPFNNDQYMGVVEDAIVKVFDMSDGSFYKYDVYDYLGLGATAGSYTDGLPPVGNNDHFFSVDSKFYNVGYLSGNVTYGSRNYSQDPEYKVNDILTDFKSKYSGPKAYDLANYNGDATGAIAPLVMDGNTIYLLATLAYDNSEGYRLHDLYLMEYDTNSQLQEIYLLGSQNVIASFFDATHIHKYGDNLYFKFRSNNGSELCSYNLTTHDYNYKVAIGNHFGFGDYPMTAYALTGSTIIIPEKVRPADYDPNDSDTVYDYDFVFKVIDISDGHVIKTLQHKDLMGLVQNEGAYIKDVYVDADSVYFTGTKWTRDTQHNIIVKIDSVGNSVDFTRYRVDAKHTGVITNR